MLCRFLPVVIVIFSALCSAQGPSGQAQDPTDARKARVRELVSQSAGEITALEPSSRGEGSAIVGFSSGDVMRCDAGGACKRLTGTPSVAVENIAVSPRGASEVLWVTYRQGTLYRCQGDVCEKVIR